MMFAQANIGFLGFGTPGAWGSDTDMVTTDGVVYTLENFTILPDAEGPGVKFRQDNDWPNNWGGTTFPSGTAIFNSSTNIPAPAGTYDITFNLTTLQYSFVNSVDYDDVSITGAFNEWGNLPMITTDGILYTLNNYTFTTGEIKFMLNGSMTNAWGGTDFPSGTGVAGGAGIPLVAGTYNVTFNKETLAYNFTFNSVTIIGSGITDWNTNVNLNTTDGTIYTLTSQVFLDGAVKFRLNGQWMGGDGFPSGTASFEGGDIMTTAGTYDLTFNRTSGGYTFSAPAAVTNYTKNTVVAYPNPANTSWTFSTVNGTLNNIQIVDLTGKVVAIQSANAQQATVNASALANGVYFAKVSSAEGTSVIKVVKN